MSQVINLISVRSSAAALNWHATTSTPKHHAFSADSAYKNFAAYAGCGSWSSIG